MSPALSFSQPITDLVWNRRKVIYNWAGLPYRQPRSKIFRGQLKMGISTDNGNKWKVNRDLIDRGFSVVSANLKLQEIT